MKSVMEVPKCSMRPVLLTSYMRPELTKLAIERVIQWDQLSKLTVVIDGLRPNADSQEKFWRNATISLVENFDNQEKLDLWVYDENVGITEHNLRLQERVMNIDSSTIFIEEDMLIDLGEYSKLRINWADESSPLLVSGYSHFNHSMNTDGYVKGNLFLPIWGLTMNKNFHELFKRTWKDKNYRPIVVREMISSVLQAKKFSEKSHLRRIIGYWEEYMSWGFKSNRRWDAVANYTLWSNGNVGLSAANRIVHDISYQDTRGMNQRSIPKIAKQHIFEEVQSQGVLFCKDCEIFGSRVPKNLLPRVWNSLSYRLSR